MIRLVGNTFLKRVLEWDEMLKLLQVEFFFLSFFLAGIIRITWAALSMNKLG